MACGGQYSVRVTTLSTNHFPPGIHGCTAADRNMWICINSDKFEHMSSQHKGQLDHVCWPAAGQHLAHDGGEVEYDEEEVAAHQAAIDAAGGWTILDDTTSGGIYCASHAACASRPVGARRRVACTFLTPPTLSAARFRADYNTYSNESTYDMPPEFAEIAASRDAWQEMADGQWQNQVTGEISAAGWVGHGVAAGGVTPRSAPAEQGSPGWASAQGWDSTCTSDDEQGF